MNGHKISLKSRRKISLSDNNKKTTSVPKYQVSIRVPETDRGVLIQIEMKLQNLGLKKTFDQDKWHIGLNLFNKLLDYVDESSVGKDTNILKYLERMIEENM